jgi:hypothetical protein
MNPYFVGRMTKMKMVLPVGKKRAWKLIATPRGLASWFPDRCDGRVAAGSFLEFGWRDGSSENFRVIYVGDKHSAFRLARRDGSQLRFYLHGKMTTLTLEVGYPSNARRTQISELALWAFYLANLKSVALSGTDLRHQLTGRSKKIGFID